MKALIAGCGYLGERLGVRLAKKGHAVWGLRRNPAALDERIGRIAADLSRPETLRELPEGLDAVVYAVSAGQPNEAAYRSAYIEGLEHLMTAVEKGAGGAGGGKSGSDGERPRLLFVSSTSVYGQTSGEWVDEDSATEPLSFRGEVLLEAEARAMRRGGGATAVRFAGIYGPGRTRLMRRLLSGAPLEAEGRPTYVNHIHVEDAAGALAHLIALPRCEAIYLGADSLPATREEIRDWLEEEAGARAERSAEIGRDAEARGNRRCRNARLVDSGYRFTYPTFREGYRPLLKEIMEETATKGVRRHGDSGAG